MSVGAKSWLLAYEHLVIFQETVGGDLQVVWGRALADSPRDVVVRTVARAEPATKVSRVGEGNATKMSADTDNHQPLWVLHAHSVFLRVAQRCNIHAVGQLDVILCPSPDEDWLSTPLDSHCGAGLDAGQIDLKGSKR